MLGTSESRIALQTKSKKWKQKLNSSKKPSAMPTLLLPQKLAAQPGLKEQQDEGSFEDDIQKKKCMWYFELLEIFQDRASVKPKVALAGIHITGPLVARR
eukprot:scaffold17045_cov71-Attheya_sp.AAC.1